MPYFAIPLQQQDYQGKPGARPQYFDAAQSASPVFPLFSQLVIASPLMYPFQVLQS